MNENPLTIEFEPPTDGGVCECCGGRTTRLTRFVSWHDAAYAVYYAMFSDNHPERYVSVLVSIGEWGEDASSAQRCSFYVRIWTSPENYQVGALDATESPWGEVELMGRTLNRQEALAHPRIKDVFHITDHIVAEDIPIIEYLTGGVGNA